MLTGLILTLVLWRAAALPAADGPPLVSLTRLGGATVAGAEIVDFEPVSGLMFVTGADGVSVLRLHADGGLEPVRTVDVGAACNLPEQMRGEVTHVMVDPAGRGFAAATVIPADRAGLQGRLVFFSTTSGEILRVVCVGTSPDCFKFSADGAYLITANEGEPVRLGGGVVTDPPGSVSVIRLDRFESAEQIRSLSQRDVRTIFFGGPVIADGLEPAHAAGTALRIHPHNRNNGTADLEPESIAVLGSTAYLTLQENNAVAAFDLRELEWSALGGLGTIDQVIDASDADGGIRIEQTVTGLPMPDQLLAFAAGGRTYLVTANEGDTRGEAGTHASPLADEQRLTQLAKAGRLTDRWAGSPLLADDRLGRLHVATDVGTDGSGRIDRPTMFGTRSVSVWDATTLARVGDTGSALERWMARLAPECFNANAEAGTFDRRSADRGPEPEGLATGMVDGRRLVIVSLERPGALAVIDLTDPTRPEVVGLTVTALLGDTAPEGLIFVPADKNPTGRPLVIGGFEVSGTVGVYAIGRGGPVVSPARE